MMMKLDFAILSESERSTVKCWHCLRLHENLLVKLLSIAADTQRSVFVAINRALRYDKLKRRREIGRARQVRGSDVWEWSGETLGAVLLTKQNHFSPSWSETCTVWRGARRRNDNLTAYRVFSMPKPFILLSVMLKNITTASRPRRNTMENFARKRQQTRHIRNTANFMSS